MADGARRSVTRLLEQVRSGDRADFNRLIEAVYPELRRMAGAYLRRERRDHVLQPTARAKREHESVAIDADRLASPIGPAGRRQGHAHDLSA